MMGSGSRLTRTMETLLLGLALVWCTCTFVTGVSGHRTNGQGVTASAVLASRSEVSSRASPFVKLQLARAQQQRSPTASELDQGCLINCQALSPFLPTCCPAVGVGVCINTQFDPLHCGKCGTVCAFGTVCCSGACTNTLTDRNNCGICGRRCPRPGFCQFGICNYA